MQSVKVEEFIKKHHLVLNYANRYTPGDKDGQECWDVAVKTAHNTGAGFEVYATPGTRVDLPYVLTWLSRYIADKPSDNPHVAYARVLTGVEEMKQLTKKG